MAKKGNVWEFFNYSNYLQHNFMQIIFSSQTPVFYTMEKVNDNVKNNPCFYLSKMLETPPQMTDIKLFYYVHSVSQQIFIEHLHVRYS